MSEQMQEHADWVVQNCKYVHTYKGKRYVIQVNSTTAVMKVGDEWHPAVLYRDLMNSGELFIRGVLEFRERFLRSQETVEDYFRRIGS